jgi:hypothetical protein
MFSVAVSEFAPFESVVAPFSVKSLPVGLEFGAGAAPLVGMSCIGSVDGTMYI